MAGSFLIRVEQSILSRILFLRPCLLSPIFALHENLGGTPFQILFFTKAKTNVTQQYSMAVPAAERRSNESSEAVSAEIF